MVQGVTNADNGEPGTVKIPLLGYCGREFSIIPKHLSVESVVLTLLSW